MNYTTILKQLEEQLSTYKACMKVYNIGKNDLNATKTKNELHGAIIACNVSIALIESIMLKDERYQDILRECNT